MDSGLYDYWKLKYVFEAFDTGFRDDPLEYKCESNLRILDLEHFTYPFIFLGWGSFGGLLIFLIEVIFSIKRKFLVGT